MDIENEIKKIKNNYKWMNINFTLVLLVILMIAIKVTLNISKLTDAISTLSQKSNVEFNVKTNDVFGIWKTMKPR